MSATDALETDLLELIFQNFATGLAIGSPNLPASVGAGSLWVALHTAAPDSPGEAPASQNVNEAYYVGYNRVQVTRAASGSPGGGWIVSGNTVSNGAELNFGQHAGSGSPASQNVTHFSIGTGSGASSVLFYGALTAPLTVTGGVTPRFAAGALQISLD